MLQGYDISSHQKGIQPGRLPGDFVIIKITQDTRVVNPFWEQWADQVLQSGKLLGLYHYAGGKDATIEADAFWAQARQYAGRAALFLDWEERDNKNYSQMWNWCRVFLARIRSLSGQMPGLYFSASLLRFFRGCGYPLWVAQYANNRPTGYQTQPWNDKAYACAIRQYSSTGRLIGWGGNLDLNKFYGTKNDWNRIFGIKGGDIVTDDDVNRIAQRVWGILIDGVRAQDRLTGIDSAANGVNNNLGVLLDSAKKDDNIAEALKAMTTLLSLLAEKQK
jgi:hypothetical protein